MKFREFVTVLHVVSVIFLLSCGKKNSNQREAVLQSVDYVSAEGYRTDNGLVLDLTTLAEDLGTDADQNGDVSLTLICSASAGNEVANSVNWRDRNVEGNSVNFIFSAYVDNGATCDLEVYQAGEPPALLYRGSGTVSNNGTLSIKLEKISPYMSVDQIFPPQPDPMVNVDVVNVRIEDGIIDPVRWKVRVALQAETAVRSLLRVKCSGYAAEDTESIGYFLIPKGASTELEVVMIFSDFPGKCESATMIKFINPDSVTPDRYASLSTTLKDAFALSEKLSFKSTNPTWTELDRLFHLMDTAEELQGEKSLGTFIDSDGIDHSDFSGEAGGYINFQKIMNLE